MHKLYLGGWATESSQACLNLQHACGEIRGLTPSRLVGPSCSTTGGFPTLGVICRNPYNKDDSILGSILVSPYSWIRSFILYPYLQPIHRLGEAGGFTSRIPRQSSPFKQRRGLWGLYSMHIYDIHMSI